MCGYAGRAAPAQATLAHAKAMEEASTAAQKAAEQDGAVVMIAPMAQMFLFGTEIDYEVSLLQAGFKFRNPNVADACGCGESIKFKDVEELAAERAAE